MARFRSRSQGEGRNTASCSFCGRNQTLVARLIAGPNVFICNECVALCQEILEEEHIAPPPAPNHPPAAPPSE